MEDKFQVRPHQEEAWKVLTSGNGNVLLRGPAAGGKTHLLKEYCKTLSNTGVIDYNWFEPDTSLVAITKAKPGSILIVESLPDLPSAALAVALENGLRILGTTNKSKSDLKKTNTVSGKPSSSRMPELLLCGGELCVSRLVQGVQHRWIQVVIEPPQKE